MCGLYPLLGVYVGMASVPFALVFPDCCEDVLLCLSIGTLGVDLAEACARSLGHNGTASVPFALGVLNR